MRKTESIDTNAKRLTVNTGGLQALLGCGRDTACKIGTAAGAKITIGRRVLWNVEKVQHYLYTIAKS